MRPQILPPLNRSIYDRYGEGHAARRVVLLRLAAGQKVRGFFTPRLRVNCEGGVGQRDPDLKWLVRKGYVAMERHADGRLGHGGGEIRTTSGKITEKGWSALWNGKL